MGLLVHHHLLYISQSVIAAHDYLVAGVETIDNLVLLWVLTTYLYVHTACHIAAFHHTVYPLATGLLVEVATGYDDGRLGLAQLYLHTVTLAQTYVLGDGGGGGGLEDPPKRRTENGKVKTENCE